MRHPSATPEDLRRLAMWLTVEEPQLRPALDEAIATATRVAQADFWQQARAVEHLEEAPFAVRDGSTVLTGVIDLMFQSPKGWRVGDYKTDVALEEQAYAGQLKAYRLALEAMGCRVAEAASVHVRNDDAASGE